jgi:hypothetical protein
MDTSTKNNHASNTSPWRAFTPITKKKNHLFKNEIKQLSKFGYITLSISENIKTPTLKKFRCYQCLNKNIYFHTIEFSSNYQNKINIIKTSPLQYGKDASLSEELCKPSRKIFQTFILNANKVKYFPLGHKLSVLENGSKLSFSCIAMMTNMNNSLLTLKLNLFEDLNKKLHFLKVERL